jgi:2-phosphosulfolactate phosphatase
VEEAEKMVVKVNLELGARGAVRAVRRRDTIVIIDVLRCSSSILNAFVNGAREVIPAKTLSEAYEMRKQHSDYLLAREIGGLRPRGFDLGNSPLEFIESNVQGKTLVLTTTSGIQALIRAKSARWVFVGAFLNARSVGLKALDRACGKMLGVSLVLSGRKGHFSLEDFICAGAVVDKLPLEDVELSDAATASLLAFTQAKDRLFETVMLGEHARHLVQLGLRADVKFSCQLDLFSIFPVFRNGVIRLLE